MLAEPGSLGLVHTLPAGLHPQGFSFSRSGWGPGICILTGFQVMLMLLVQRHVESRCSK